ncbi:hypothetical protein Pnap_4361 (plasmid) [Polaromonas naphthalenivorans CJ2]|uniref:HTH-like domain-containing protein n=1 Tax=Polaromonas naphthalenivorans (strain CJ2) TaxID=365044 RepID=A1VVG3_POLNA|nr:hypothetical protein Pnap_4361 [Polaromonas naphthalenivorans CJ2]
MTYQCRLRWGVHSIAFIQRHRHAWPVSVQCRVLRVSAAGYHEHLARRASNAQRRHLSDEALLVHIKALHAETRSAYGWPRIWRELVARGVPVGKERVQKLMQLHGIRAKGKRRFKVTTDSNHKLPISPNLLNREFTVAEPDRVWVGDITYIDPQKSAASASVEELLLNTVKYQKALPVVY